MPSATYAPARAEHVQIHSRQGKAFDLRADAVRAAANAADKDSISVDVSDRHWSRSRVWVEVDHRPRPALEVIARALRDSGVTVKINFFTWGEAARALQALGFTIQDDRADSWTPRLTEASGLFAHARPERMAIRRNEDTTAGSPEATLNPGADPVGYEDPSSASRGSVVPLSKEDEDTALLPPPLSVQTAVALSEHAGRWVGVRGDVVVSVADSPSEVIAITDADSASPVLVTYVPDSEDDTSLPVA